MNQLILPGMEVRKPGKRRPYDRGYRAYTSPTRWEGNPYPAGTKSALAWNRGWKDARDVRLSIALIRLRKRERVS